MKRCISILLLAVLLLTCVPAVSAASYSGFTQMNGETYYYDADGSRHTGWLELDGKQYYFFEDGTMAMGIVQIDGKTYHFLENGQRFYLVNPWNYIPDDYEAEIVKYSGKRKLAQECVEPLKQMLKDCRKAGHGVLVVSTYRTNAQQTTLYNRKVQKFLNKGYSRSKAKQLAGRSSAIPGTSEHQLGLAVDIVDSSYVKLNYKQADRPTQKWLMKNSWKYGFTLRYPTGKSNLTGIIFEPWHYRYVGVELAKELYDRDICLEEYFEDLTRRVENKKQIKELASMLHIPVPDAVLEQPLP